jgi:hypothetical protein
VTLGVWVPVPLKRKVPNVLLLVLMYAVYESSDAEFVKVRVSADAVPNDNATTVKIARKFLCIFFLLRIAAEKREFRALPFPFSSPDLRREAESA